MTDLAGMFAGVPIRRAVTAQGNATLLTGAEMDPLCADLHALSAFANLRLFDGRDRVEMRAGTIAHLRLLLFEAASRR
jgi:hypothetical protein